MKKLKWMEGGVYHGYLCNIGIDGFLDLWESVVKGTVNKLF